MKNSKNIADKDDASSSNPDIEDESEVISQREQDQNLKKKAIQQSIKPNHGNKDRVQAMNANDVSFSGEKKKKLMEVAIDHQYNINSSVIDTSQFLHQNNYNNPNEKTDISNYMLNVTNISNNNMLPDMIFDEDLPKFKEGKQNSLLDSQSLNIKQINKNILKDTSQNKRVSSLEANQIVQPQNGEYLSQQMLELKICIDLDDEKRFEEILNRELYDSEEVLMYLYAALSCFNSDRVFQGLLRKNNYFEVDKEFNQLFSNPHIFMLMQGFSPSVERRQFDCITLKISLERDFFFMTDKILDRSAMSKEMIQIMLQENQKKLLIQQLSKSKKPTYLDVDQYNLNIKNRSLVEDIERDLHFNDIIYAALDKSETSQSVIELIKLMKNELQSKFFEEPDKEFNLKDLFRIFVIRRKIKLLRFLFSLQNEFDFTPQLFIEALELESFDIGALLYKEFFRRLKDQKKENEYIITILISSLNKNNGQLDFKAYLVRSYVDQFILRHANSFLDTLDSKIVQENKYNILVMNLNVVKTACLLIEILEMISNQFERLKVRCQTLRGKIEQIAKRYMVAIESEQEMRYLLLEKDFENRDPLELITRYRITPMLESQFADNVVREIWRSPYSTNNSLFSASTNHKLIFYYWNCIKDDELTSRFYHSKDLKSFEAHPLQFTVWRFSGKSRILVEFFATGIVAAIIHILVNSLLQESSNISNVLGPFFQLENQLNSITDKTSQAYITLENQYRISYINMSNSADIFFQKVLIVSYVSLMPLMFAFQHIFNIVYGSINKRLIDPFAFLNLLDLTIFAIFFTNIIVTYCKDLYGTWTDYPLLGDETRAVVYTRNYYGGLVSEDAIWICCIVILWVRVFYLLRYNEFIGKFMGIVERLIYDVFLFFCFYVLQLMFFALIAEICFRRLTDYNTSYKAFKTLFYASMGQFSFDEMQQADYGEYFGITFMIIFLVCNIGIIMNLFISVITVLYDGFSEHQNVYQMLETLKLRSYTQADKEYSALISIPAPLNILHVIFAPFLLTSRNPSKLNEVILCIAYIPVMFAVTLLFIVYQIVLIPFTYTKLFFHKMVMIYVYSKSYRVSRADKFITFVFFIFFGPFSLSLNAIVDIWYFLQHLWMREMPKTKHKTNDKQLSKDTLEKLNIYFKNKQEKILPYKKLAVDIRDELEIIQGVSNIVRPSGIIKFLRNPSIIKSQNDMDIRASQVMQDNPMMDEKALNFMFSSINEYSVIKNILERNSDFIKVFDSNQRIKTVDCKIIYSMINDLYRFKTALKVQDEDFIFIRRAVNIKSINYKSDKKKKYQDSDKSEQQPLSVQLDSEGSKDSKRRQKLIFKKFLFLNTKRMLEILNFKTGESESKKLLYAMEKDEGGQQSKNNVLSNLKANLFGINRPQNHNFEPYELEGLEEKVYQMGNINPFFTTTLESMKTEIQNLCIHLSNIQSQQKQLSEKEKNYQFKISGLYEELQNIKDEKENEKSRTQQVIENYFYDRKASQKKQQFQSRDIYQPHELPFEQAQDFEREEVQPKQPQKQEEDFLSRLEKNIQQQQPKQHGHQKIGQPSPQKNSKHFKFQTFIERIETESDIPDVDDD